MALLVDGFNNLQLLSHIRVVFAEDVKEANAPGIPLRHQLYHVPSTCPTWHLHTCVAVCPSRSRAHIAHDTSGQAPPGPTICN